MTSGREEDIGTRPICESRTGLRAISKLIAGTFVRQVLSALLGLATAGVTARWLGPTGNGMLAVALLLPASLSTFLNLGLAPAGIYFLSSSRIGFRQLIEVYIRLVAWMSLFGMIVGLLLIGYSGSLFRGVEPWVLIVALMLFPVNLASFLLQATFQGLQDFRSFNLILLGQSAIYCLAVVAVALTSPSNVILVLCAQIATQVAVVIWSLNWLRPLFLAPCDRVDAAEASSALLRYGLKSHLGSVVSYINYRADLVLVNLFLGPEVSGVYAIAALIGERIWLIPQAVGTVLFPRLSLLSRIEADQRVLTPIVARWVLSVTFCAALLVAALSVPLIAFGFGPRYTGAVAPLFVLLPGFVLASSSQVLANDIAARGRPELNLATSSAALMLNICASILLTPRFGMLGAALSTTLALTLNTTLKLILYCRLSRNDWRACVLLSWTDGVTLWAAVRAVSTPTTK